MCWAILVKSDGATEQVEYPPREPEHLPYLQKAVGGYVEFHDLPSLHATLVADEDGKMKAKPVNPLATSLYRANRPGSTDFLVGDVLIVGPSDANGILHGLSALEADLVEAALAVARD